MDVSHVALIASAILAAPHLTRGEVVFSVILITLLSAIASGAFR